MSRFIFFYNDFDDFLACSLIILRSEVESEGF